MDDTNQRGRTVRFRKKTCISNVVPLVKSLYYMFNKGNFVVTGATKFSWV